MNSGIQKPPVAPKPKNIHSPKPGMSPATPRREGLSVLSPATTRKPKPALAPKPCVSKLTTTVPSQNITKPPATESPLTVFNSQNGLQQENKKPNWDYIVPICLCSQDNCYCIKKAKFDKRHEELKTQNKGKPETESRKTVSESIGDNGEANTPIYQNTTQNNSVVTASNDVSLSNLKSLQELLTLDQHLNTVKDPSSPALTNSPSLPPEQCSDEANTCVIAQTAPKLGLEEDVLGSDQVSCMSNTNPVPSTPRKPNPVPVPRKPRMATLDGQEKVEEKIVNQEGSAVSSKVKSSPSSSVSVPASAVVHRKNSFAHVPRPNYAPPAPPPKKPLVSELVKTFRSQDVEEEDLGWDVYEMEVSVDKEDEELGKDRESRENPLYSSVTIHRPSSSSPIQPPAVTATEEDVVKVTPQKPQRRRMQKKSPEEQDSGVLEHNKKREMRLLQESKELATRELPPGDRIYRKAAGSTRPSRSSLRKSKSFSGVDIIQSEVLRKNSIKKLLEWKLTVKKLPKWRAKGGHTQDSTDSDKEPCEEDGAENLHNEYRGERKLSCPIPDIEQNVDGDVFSPEEEQRAHYETIPVYENIPVYKELTDYVNVNVGDEATSSWDDKAWPSPMNDSEAIYEEQEPYMTLDKNIAPPLEHYDYPRGSLLEGEERLSDEDFRGITSEEEEEGDDDDSSISSKGEHEQTEETASEKKKNKIQHIATEIMTSESVFVDVLKLLHVDFRDAVCKASLQNGKPVIEDRLLNQILYSLPQLYELNQDLLKELQQRVANWDSNSKVADIFLKKGPYLKMYSTYIREFDKNVALLEEQTKKNPAFGSVVREYEASPRCANLALRHYLLKPVQRIPQYQLLLTDYLKNLSEDSTDYKDTHEALVIVKEVANHANDIMKQGDIFQKLIQVQCRLMGNHELVQPGRIFLKEGVLKKLSRKVMQPRMFFLFNDILLYTTPVQTGQYKVNNTLSLAGMKVSKPNLEAYQNELNIESVERSFILSASSATERDAWLESISIAITDYTKKKTSFVPGTIEEVDNGNDALLGSIAPIWIPDPRATMCMLCTFEFTLTWRRHHCRACGKVVCQACSSNKYRLKYLKNQLARVCDQCFKVLQQKDEKALSAIVSPGNRSTFAFTRKHKNIPSYLKEVSANTDNSSMSGYLEKIKGKKKQGKRLWFVIKNKVLYTYAASENVAALKSQPLLGFTVESDSELQFKLYHKNTLFYVFKADDVQTAQRWVEAFKEASVL